MFKKLEGEREFKKLESDMDGTEFICSSSDRAEQSRAAPRIPTWQKNHCVRGSVRLYRYACLADESSPQENPEAESPSVKIRGVRI